MPKTAEPWWLTSLLEKLIKIGAKDGSADANDQILISAVGGCLTLFALEQFFQVPGQVNNLGQKVVGACRDEKHRQALTLQGSRIFASVALLQTSMLNALHRIGSNPAPIEEAPDG